ncbi:MAG: ABC transporter permease subunit [Chloroflexi bacterium]|nr:ABC transporter permease subunit [Chloroflexota bacterium]
MSATIYLHEFRTRLKSVLIWSGSLTALVFFFFSLFPSFAEQAALMQQMMANFPPALLEAFGMTKVDLSSLMGFYGFLFAFVQLCLAIQAGNYGFGLVSIEESELTADFLLSKPVSRLQVLISKLLAAVSNLLLTMLIVTVVSLVAIALFNDGHEYAASTLILVLVSGILLQLFFLGVGLVISLLVKRIRSVTPWSLGLAFGAYVLSAFSGILGEIKLEYITPFKHLDPAYIVLNAGFNTPLVLLNVAVTLVSLAASTWLYLRRDIPAVS